MSDVRRNLMVTIGDGHTFSCFPEYCRILLGPSEYFPLIGIDA
jgi:hypothetical protein